MAERSVTIRVGVEARTEALERFIRLMDEAGQAAERMGGDPHARPLSLGERGAAETSAPGALPVSGDGGAAGSREAAAGAEAMARAMTAASTQAGRLAAALPAAGAAMQGLARGGESLGAAITRVGEQLARLSATETRLRFRAEVIDPSGVLALAQSGGLDAAIQGVVEANGGRVPGASNR